MREGWGWREGVGGGGCDLFTLFVCCLACAMVVVLHENFSFSLSSLLNQFAGEVPHMALVLFIDCA